MAVLPQKNSEQARLNALKEYRLLNTPTTPDFKNITSLAASCCKTPIAMVSLMYKNDNHMLSCYGTSMDKSPRDISFCTHAIESPKDIYIVNDTHKNELFKNNPIVEKYNVQFYAGVPLINKKGHALGTLCVYDHEPRELSQIQQNTLIALAEQVVTIIELRKKNYQLKNIENELINRNKQLESFTYVVSHDLKSPLANIISLAQLLREENTDNLNDDSLQYLDYIEESSDTLKNYIDGTLAYYKANKLLEEQKTDIHLKPFFEKIKELLGIQGTVLEYPTVAIAKNINEAALTQIILNLIDNALKYNTSKNPKINIQYEDQENYHTFTVTDNGMGIAKNTQGAVFELFKTTGVKDRKGKQGTGIGLATVKKLVNKMDGTVLLESDIGQGSTFIFTVKK